MRHLAIFAISIFSIAAQAQDSVSIETIQVRGTKEEKAITETPESVSILQDTDVSTAGRENDLQVLNALPNVDVNKGGESFSIRGINNAGVTGYQKDNLASILIDGIFQTDLALQAGSFDLWDLDRIEVLRGAQSTSLGVNSLAGAILLDHRGPSTAREGAAKFGLGSYGYRDLGIVANEPFGDVISARVSAGKEVTDGFITNTATGNTRWGRTDKDRASLRLESKLAAGSSLALDGKFHRNRQGGTYIQNSDQSVYEVSEDQESDLATENTQIALTYQRPVSEKLSSTTLLGLSRANQNAASDADGTSRDTAGVRIENHRDDFTSFETRLHYKNEGFSNLFGLHHHGFGLDDDFEFNLLFPLSATTSTPVSVDQKVSRSRKATALFDSVTVPLAPAQNLLLGVRAEYVESRYSADVSGSRNRDLGPATNAFIDNYISQISGAYEGKKSSFVLLPKVGYTVGKDAHQAGAFYTRGYRTSGVSINRRRARAAEYDPEFTNNYELSYKFAPSPEASLSANAFYIDWRDQQVQVQLTNDFYDTEVRNAAKSRVLGGEIEAKTALAARQTLSAGVGYSDTRFEDFKNAGVDYEGRKFPFAPNWTLRIGHDWQANEALGFLTVLRSVSGAFANAENTRRSDAQVIANFGARYTVGSWLAEAFVNNLFDGHYRLFDGTPTNPASPYQASYHRVSAPRELGARLLYYW